MELIRKANGDVEIIVSQPVMITQQATHLPENLSTLSTYKSNDSDYDIDDNSVLNEPMTEDERSRAYNSLPDHHRSKTPTHLDDEQVRAAVSYQCC